MTRRRICLPVALVLAASAAAASRPAAARFDVLYNRGAVDVDPARLVEFLGTAGEQAAALPPREGFHLLRDTAERLLDRRRFRLPAGVRTALRGAGFAGYEARSYAEGRTVLTQGFAAIAAAATPLSGEPAAFFPALLSVARATAAGVSDETAYVALRGYLSAARISPEQIPTPVLRFTVEAARRASDRPCADAEGRVVLDLAYAAMEAAGATESRAVYLDAAAGLPAALPARAARRALKEYVRRLLGGAFLTDDLERVSLESALRVARLASTADAAVAALHGALEGLR